MISKRSRLAAAASARARRIRRLTTSRRPLWIAPLLGLALLLQAYAVVKSTVMTAPRNPAAFCGMSGGMSGERADASAGMAMRMERSGAHRRAHSPASAPCAYCADAAPIPLAAPPPELAPPTQFSYAAYLTEPEPPAPVRLAVTPRARGPPQIPV